MNEVRLCEWWRGASIYQIYPRSFLDSTGSGIGDINGIISKLDYISNLQVDGIWISPFFTSPMADFGYDVADYKNVDRLFGNIDDFRRLVNEAHLRRLKVIIDQVYSHTSNKHPWFQESTKSKNNIFSDWYVWADAKQDGAPPNNWQSTFGGSAWTWNNQRKQYYLHNFLSEQPDLNLHNELVQEAVFDVAKFWLDLGVDGFRLDAINCGMHDTELKDNPPNYSVPEENKKPYSMQHHINNMSQPGMPEFLMRFRKFLDQYKSTFTVAEVGGDNPISTMKAYINGADKLNTAYSFDFLAMPNLNKDAFRNIIEKWSNDADEGWPSWAFSNHDAPRVLSRWGKNKSLDKKAKLYLLLLVSLRGNLFLYQGEELGLLQSNIPYNELQDPEAINNWPNTLGRDGARTPIPWKKLSANFGFSTNKPWLPVLSHTPSDCVSEQEHKPDSTLNFCKKAFSFRKHNEILRRGDLEFVESNSPLIVFERKYNDEKLLCVFNLTEETLSIDINGYAIENVCLSNVGLEDIQAGIPAHSGAILSVTNKH